MSTHAQNETTHAQSAYTAPAPAATADRSGLVVFAAVMLVVAGVYHALIGLAAIFQDDIYVATPSYTYELDLTGWGWTHLLLGVLVVATGVAVAQGASWGRVVGIGLVVISLIANFLFLPHYPVWALLVIAIDIVIICALATAPRRA